ncbi:MAG: FAD:protein FMN transferase [Bacteroidota bacterium]
MAGKVFHENIYSMGTRFDVVFPSLDQKTGQAVFNEITQKLKHIEHLLNRHEASSRLNKINQEAAYEEQIIEADLWEILSACREFHQKTYGAFDITIAPLMKLWNIKHGYKIDLFEPSEEEIKNVLGIVGMDLLDFQDHSKTLRFKKEGVQIDFGGFAKGFALEKIKDILQYHNITDAFISFGESSILGIGSHPYSDSWKTGVTHMIEKNDSIYTFNLNNQAISNSGSNISETGFNKYGHIINPKTGYPVKGNITISVFSASPVEAEILSSSLLVSEPGQKKKILNNFPGCRAVQFEYPNMDKEVKVTELN